MKRSPVEIHPCTTCGADVRVPAWKAKGQQRFFCDTECYQKDHATTPKTCATCGTSFVSKNYDKRARYCCQACVPMTGESNPNYGRRHPGMWTMPAHLRLAMSDRRTGEGNPNWKGGSPTAGKFQHQTFARAWALNHLPHRCAVCGEPGSDLHHIAPVKCFRPRRLAHFAENLLLVCEKHSIRAMLQNTQALQARRPRDLLCADRLPESILRALEQGGSVSSPQQGCDYSPLGNVAELVAPMPASDTAAARAASGPSG